MAKQSTSLFSERFLNPNHELRICEADYLGNELNRGTLRDIEEQLDSHYSTLDDQYFVDRANTLSREGYTKCSEILPPSLLKKVTREQVRIMDETARRIDIKIDVTDDTPRKMETVNYDNILVDGQSISMASFLASEDLIFNCAGQDAEAPVNYMTIDELETLDHDCSIVDISCDPAMGFPFSRTTTFHTPSYMVGRMRVYSVDHIPGYFYDAGTWVYTRGLKPWLMDIKLGKSHWLESEIINPAIEILDGNIRNAKIIEYQQRETDHPHYCKDPQAWRLTVDANRVAIRKSLDGPVEI